MSQQGVLARLARHVAVGALAVAGLGCQSLDANSPSALTTESRNAQPSGSVYAQSDGNASKLASNSRSAVAADTTVWRDAARSRDVRVALFAPARAGGLLPTVVFSPGFSESPEAYRYLGEHLASHGYLVAIVNHQGSDRAAFDANGWRALSDPAAFDDRPADLSFAIDQLLAGRADFTNARVDPERIGIAGHSLGSTTALSLAGATVNTATRKSTSFRDPRTKAVIAMSPQVGGGPTGQSDIGLHDRSWDSIQVPAMVMTGTRDAGVSKATRSNPDARRVVFESIPGPDTYYLNIVDAQHHAFTETPPVYPGGARDPRHHEWIAAAATEFFDAYLKGDGAAGDRLRAHTLESTTGGEAMQDSKAGQSGSAAGSQRSVRAAGTSGFDEIGEFMRKQLAAAPNVPGAGVLIMAKDGTVVYEEYFGRWDEQTTVPIASASKWWAAATIMTLVDAGLISLDDPVADYLPEFRNKGNTSKITLRNTLNFTAGYAPHIAAQDDADITQSELSRIIADTPLQYEPGTAFMYGGLQMEIAGRIAEVVTGKPYSEIFDERIVRPLGLADTRIGSMRNRRPTDMVFESKNPLVPGGVVTSMADYKRFLEMLMNDGVYRGTRVLSSAAMAEMLRDQTGSLPILRSGQEDESYHYALGAWYRVRPDGGDVILSSGGALGTNPWINLNDEYAAALITLGQAGQMKEAIWRLTDLVTDLMDGQEVDAGDYEIAGNPGRAAGSRVPGGAAGRGSRPGGGAAGGSAAMLSRLDRNGDGLISRSEVPSRAVRILENFDRLDRNSDGNLSPDELPGGSAGSQRPSGGSATAGPGRTPAGSAVELKTGASPATAVTSADARGPYAIEEIESLVLEDGERSKLLQMRVVSPVEAGTFPVIVYSHYSGGSRMDYDSLVYFWASHGYVVILPDHSDSPAVGGQRGAAARQDLQNRPLDISFIVSSLDQIASLAPALAGRMDARRVAAGGHYIGAYTANLLAGMRLDTVPDMRDERISAFLLMSAQGTGQGVEPDAWQDVHVPMMVMTGSNDGSGRTGNTAEWRTEPYQYSPPGDKYLVWMEDLDSSYGGIVGDGRSNTADASHLLYTQEASLAFWDAYLKDAASQRDYLRSNALEVESGDRVTISWK